MIRRCDLVPQYEAYADEIGQAIERVLRSGRYTLADEGRAFEQEFAAYLGARHVVGVANGTEALTLSLRALGVGPGDEVITTPFTAIPTVSAIVAAGATPVFADVDPATYLIDVGRVRAALTNRTRAVVPVHLFGNVVDVPELRAAIGAEVAIVEDACQAHGSRLGARQAGTLGDLGAFSFYPTKNLGGYGDGGAVATDDPALAERIRLLRMYGMTDKDHIRISGVNSRLDELQAAILRVKLRHLDEMNARRRALAARYRERLPGRAFTCQRIPDAVISNEHVFVARVRTERDALVRELAQRGVQTNVYYPLPLHLQEALAHLGYEAGDFPAAEALCDEVIALPLYPELAEQTLEQVLQRIEECVR